MRAVTIRRSLVFAVCTIGVACLYLAPGAAPSPDELGSKPPADEPTARPGGRSSAPVAPTSARAPDRSQRTSSGRRPDVADRSSDDGADEEDRDTNPTTQPAGRGPGRAGSPYDPDDTRDREPPQPVREIKTATVTPDRLGLSWSAARDNVRVVGYHVWLNGFEVASTAETRVSVPWFNDDTSTNVVQVKAVDAAGNESESSPSVLVTRPDPEPSPTDPPSTEAPAEPKPTASDKPTTEPSHEAEAEATSKPTGAPSGSDE